MGTHPTQTHMHTHGLKKSFCLLVFEAESHFVALAGGEPAYVEQVCTLQRGCYITDGCESPRGCWEPNPGPLQDQQVPLTTEPTLQTPKNKPLRQALAV